MFLILKDVYDELVTVNSNMINYFKKYGDFTAIYVDKERIDVKASPDEINKALFKIGAIVTNVN